MNMFIGLCKNTKKWPCILHDLGYDVQLIEQRISLESSDTITPDVVAVSNKQLHAIVAECKSGNNTDTDQENRYNQLKSVDLYYAGINTYDHNQLTFVVCYVDNESNHKSLELHTKLPFITFDQKAIHAIGDFNDGMTNKKLQNAIPLVKVQPVSTHLRQTTVTGLSYSTF